MVVNPHHVPIPHPRTGRLKNFAAFYPFYLGELQAWTISPLLPGQQQQSLQWQEVCPEFIKVL